MHSCAECGLEHEGAGVAAEPVAVAVDPGPNENDVKIEEIRAATEVATAEISADERVIEMGAEIERLRGERDGFRAALEAMAPPPPPEPEPVVIPVPDPGAGPAEPGGAVPDAPRIPKKSGDKGWFGGYR